MLRKNTTTVLPILLYRKHIQVIHIRTKKTHWVSIL